MGWLCANGLFHHTHDGIDDLALFHVDEALVGNGIGLDAGQADEAQEHEGDLDGSAHLVSNSVQCLLLCCQLVQRDTSVAIEVG